jgi:hypothetical protein
MHASGSALHKADEHRFTRQSFERQGSKAIMPLGLPLPDPGCRGGARRRVECGDMPFLIKRDGTWLYQGTPIPRKELVCLFSSVLKREADGSFWLETPAERGRIEVEDSPFVAVELDWCGCGRDQKLTFRTNIDQLVTAGPDHPIRVAHDVLTCEPTPYIKLRDGGGHHAIEARIGRAVYYELVALAEPCTLGGQRRLGVWSCGRFFSLGDLPPGDEGIIGDSPSTDPHHSD